MRGKLIKSEQGFTMVELMISLVLFTLVLGLSSRALASGLGMSSKQSNQLDLRMDSRQILTQMEKDVQAAASISANTKLVSSELVQNIDLTDKDGTIYKTYRYIPSQRKLVMIQGGTTKTLASNMTAVNFFGGLTANGQPPASEQAFPGISKVAIAVTMNKGSETLDITTNASPRWNVGNDVPAIISVNPRSLTNNATAYELTSIVGINTHFTSSSVITFKQGNEVWATSNFVGNTIAAPNNTTLSNVWLHTSNGLPLPWGFYDLYVSTPTASGTEIVWASSVITCLWDSKLWLPTVGANNSGGWNASTFPFVEKTNANNNDKYDAYTARTQTDFDIKLKITITSGGNTAKTSPFVAGTGNQGTTITAPDAEVTLWAANDGSGTKHCDKYLGFGIDSDSVFLRPVGWPSFPGTNKTIKIPNIVTKGQAILQATASGGILHFYVNGYNIDSQIDAVDTHIRDTSGKSYSGYPGVITSGDVTVLFTIMRL